MKYLIHSILIAGFLLIGCTDRNHNGDPDYREDRDQSTNEKGENFDRTRPGSSAGTITDANDADRDASNHPTEGAEVKTNPPAGLDTTQTLPK